MPQPRRVDAHGGDTAGFVNLYFCNGLGQLRDVTLDVRVELFSKSVNLIPGAAEQNALVQRQHFLEHGRDLPVWQMDRPLHLEVFQLRRDPAGQGF